MQPYQTIAEICAALAARPDAWAKVCEGQSYIPLLLLLEHPYSAVVAQLVDRLMAAGVARAEAERVSLRQLVIFALTGPMRWAWGGYAVSWIEAGFLIDDEIASALNRSRRISAFRNVYGTKLSQLPSGGGEPMAIPGKCDANDHRPAGGSAIFVGAGAWH